jgi:predicted transcriptional regulator
MKKHNRQEFAVAHRRMQVAELYLKGLSQPAIAEQLGVSQPTVSGDLKAIQQQWRASDIRNFEERRAMELQKIDLVEREAWDAWERSKKPAQSATVTGAGNGQHTRKSVKNQIGDPRFLEQVNKCISQRRDLLALDVQPAAKPLETHFNANVPIEVRWDRIRTLLVAVAECERFGAHGAGSDPGQPGNIRGGDQRGPLENGPAPGPSEPDAADSH